VDFNLRAATDYIGWSALRIFLQRHCSTGSSIQTWTPYLLAKLVFQ